MTTKKTIANILLGALGAALLIYTGSRTLHLLEMTLPTGQTWLAWLALAAFDGGLLLWTAYALFGADGAAQRGVSLVMVVLSLLGVVIGFAGDTLLTAGTNGIIAEIDDTTALTIIYATSAIIALHIVALTACHLTDPEAQKKSAIQEAKAKATAAALAKLAENSDQLAAELAPALAADWLTAMRAELTAHLPTKNEPITVLPQPALPARGNDRTHAEQSAVKFFRAKTRTRPIYTNGATPEKSAQ
jgi:hypothetical protein